MFGLQYLNYISLVKGRCNRPFLIHTAVNFQLMSTGRSYPWWKEGIPLWQLFLEPEPPSLGPPLIEATAAVDSSMGVTSHHALMAPVLSTFCPSTFSQVGTEKCGRVNAQRQSSFDGENARRWSSLVSQEDDSSGRCSLQLSKVLEDQSSSARSSSDLHCAFHFGFSFCLLHSPCSLTPTFQDHLSNKLPGPKTWSLALILEESLPRNLIFKFFACSLDSCLMTIFYMSLPQIKCLYLIIILIS